MNVLAIETATDAVGVAVLRADGGSAERVHAGGREHAERLVPMIEEVTAAAACPLSEIGAVAVDVGPGLFTGLRVGVATAKTLAYARRLELVGVSSLDVLAAAAATRVAEDPDSGVTTIVSVVDARRGEVFAAAYAARPTTAGPWTVDAAPAVDDRPGALHPDELVEWCGRHGTGRRSVLVVGDGAVRYLDRLALDSSLDIGTAATLAVPPAATLARVAAQRLVGGAGSVRPDALVPDYRRSADVRINWEQRAARPSPPAGSPARDTGGSR